MVHVTNSYPTRGIISKPEDIIFTKAYENWVHHPHEDALGVTTKIANSLVQRMLVDNGSAVNILYWFYWDAYQKTGLTWVDLSPVTSPLYGFSGDHVILERTIKLAAPWENTPEWRQL